MEGILYYYLESYHFASIKHLYFHKGTKIKVNIICRLLVYIKQYNCQGLKKPEYLFSPPLMPYILNLCSDGIFICVLNSTKIGFLMARITGS